MFPDQLPCKWEYKFLSLQKERSLHRALYHQSTILYRPAIELPLVHQDVWSFEHRPDTELEIDHPDKSFQSDRCIKNE